MKKQRGFSLIEVLIAVAILAAISTAGMFGAMKVMTRQNTYAEQDMQKIIADALTRYYNDTGAWPPAVTGVRCMDYLRQPNGCGGAAVNGWKGPYIGLSSREIERDQWWNDSLPGATRTLAVSTDGLSAALVAWGPNHTLDSILTGFPVTPASDDVLTNLAGQAAVAMGANGIGRAKVELRQIDTALGSCLPTCSGYTVPQLIADNRISASLLNDPWGHPYVLSSNQTFSWGATNTGVGNTCITASDWNVSCP